MKRKIIYLLVAVLCLTAFLPSCDKEGASAVCEAHVDADANLSCDNCGIPMYTVVKDVPVEEVEVPTVFAEIPDDATIADLLNGTPANLDAILSTNTTASDRWFDAENGTHNVSNVASGLYLITYTLINNEDPSNVTNTKNILVYNTKTAQCIFNRSVTYAEGSTPETQYSVNAVSAYGDTVAFEVITTTTYDYDSEPDVSYSFYTLEGKAIVTGLKKADTSTDLLVGGEFVLTVNDTVYVIDDDKVTNTLDKSKFVARPNFDSINEEKNLGFLVKHGDKTSVLVYDLTKWIECIWSYEVPSSYDTEVFFLANGNLLVQTLRVVAPGSVNYDFTDGQTNYDIDYFVVDVTAKTSTEIEFGYYIDDIEVADSDTDAAAVRNWIEVRKIANKNLSDTYLELATDDNLNIIGEYAASLPSALIEDIRLVAKDTFLATLYYGEGTQVHKLYKADGTEIATLPNSADIYDGFILMDNTVYNFNMKAVFTPSETQSYTYWYDNYFIIYDTGDSEKNIEKGYYYVSATSGTPVPLTLDVTDYSNDGVTPISRTVSDLIDHDDDYFVIRTRYTDYNNSENDYVVYKLYNEKSQLVYSGDYNVSRFIKGEGVFTIVFEDGSVIVSK